jgi:hypothetical protein
MDECLCSRLGECGTEAGNVTEVEKGCFGNIIDMGLVGEGGIQDDTKVADFIGGGDGGSVNVEGEIYGGAGEGIRTNDEDFGFIAVEFEEVVLHPSFNISQAGGESGVGGSSDGFGGEVQLGVVGITVKMEAMAAEDLTKGENVDDNRRGPSTEP